MNTEKKVLSRNADKLTSKTGYAGGSRLGKDTNRPGGKGLACYHNMMNIADYGQLGHAGSTYVYTYTTDVHDGYT